MVNITAVDLLRFASSIPYVTEITSIPTEAPDAVHFISYNETFVTDILGPTVSQKLIAETSWEAFHEAGVYNAATNSLYITSNWAKDFSNPINVTVLSLDDYSLTSLRYPNVANANGAFSYYPPGTPRNSSAGQEIVFCDEGNLEDPSQLTVVNPATNATRVILNSYMGKNFSSINDIIQHPVTGDLWFTDARYGYWQFFRPEPVIRPQVYRFEPASGVLQAVADDFIAPNGIEFSPDLKHIYVTDTGTIMFSNESAIPTNPASIYKYDISADGKGLENRKLFAYASGAAPDGVHADTQGNIYSSCTDGVNVWNKEGVLLGKFAVKGGSNNFAWVPQGMILFNNNRAFEITLAAKGRTVRKDFGAV
ncbi:hypothetical protein AAFC00_003359 [Neodothiora populina]|uniref:SMP-30/Gluconolactonase/LRE-like region domain-containing protein n=1 Tax=Neodothiora populina TaxID=2781224 RepID=A0ABR3PAE7_9PEZI